MTVELLLLAGIVIQLLVAVFVYGKLTQKVTSQDESIAAIEQNDVDQWKRITNHETRISHLEGGASRRMSAGGHQ